MSEHTKDQAASYTILGAVLSVVFLILYVCLQAFLWLAHLFV